MVVILNINLIMEPAIVRNTLGTLYAPNEETRKYLGAVHITVTLASLTCLGYIILTAFLAYTEIPIVIREIDQVGTVNLNLQPSSLTLTLSPALILSLGANPHPQPSSPP